MTDKFSLHNIKYQSGTTLADYLARSKTKSDHAIRRNYLSLLKDLEAWHKKDMEND